MKITCVWLFHQGSHEQFYKLLFATPGEIRHITFTPIRKLAIDRAVLSDFRNRCITLFGEPGRIGAVHNRVRQLVMYMLTRIMQICSNPMIVFRIINVQFKQIPPCVLKQKISEMGERFACKPPFQPTATPYSKKQIFYQCYHVIAPVCGSMTASCLLRGFGCLFLTYKTTFAAQWLNGMDQT